MESGDKFRKISPERLLFQKENLDLLEHILDRETRKLCLYKEFKKITEENRKYSKGELEAILPDAKRFVDDLLKIECSSPNIGKISLFENNIFSYMIMLLYSMSGAGVAFSSAVSMINRDAGIMMAFPAVVMALSTYEFHKKIKLRSDYSVLNKKITMESANEFTVHSTVAHEYSHHVLLENKILNEFIDEGFTRGIERLYARHVAESKNDERYSYESSWTHCLAVNTAYKRACSKIGRKSRFFEPLSNAISLEKSSYNTGCALFILAEEREGKDTYRNFISSYQFSRALFKNIKERPEFSPKNIF